MTNTATRASTDPRYISYAFDCLVNLNLRGQDSRVILSRGLGCHGPSKCGVAPREQLFDNNSIDSRPVVNQLSASNGEETPHYFFYTHTLNQSEHFGIRRMKQRLDSEEIVDQFCGPNAPYETREDVKDAILQGSTVFMCRQWWKCPRYI